VSESPVDGILLDQGPGGHCRIRTTLRTKLHENHVRTRHLTPPAALLRRLLLGKTNTAPTAQDMTENSSAAGVNPWEHQ